MKYLEAVCCIGNIFNEEIVFVCKTAIGYHNLIFFAQALFCWKLKKKKKRKDPHKNCTALLMLYAFDIINSVV